MALQKVTITVDDLTGDHDAEPVEFTYKGETYEIDLAKSGSSMFDKAMRPFIKKARKVTPKRKSAAAKPATKKPVTATSERIAIRDWAAANGIELSPRGRIPAAVIEQYRLSQKPAEA